MSTLFYLSGAIAVIAGVLVVTRVNVMHAVINLIMLLLAVASVFYTLGAPFVAALQVIIYAGAIMILFVFVVMMLNLGRAAEERERGWLASVSWIVPVLLTAILLLQFIATVAVGPGTERRPFPTVVGPEAVGRNLYTDYLIGVELASLLLLAGLVAAFHFGVLPGRVRTEDE